MKERILFVCIGGGAGNIGQLFENNGYNCLFINTSNDDLSTLDAKHKLHIPSAYGCNKNRQKALEYAKNYYPTMTEVIDKKFPQQDIIYTIFCLGGGTGSGISPILLEIMTNKNPKKSYGAICIIPSIQESVKAQTNAVEAYSQLVKIEKLKNIFVLDNNNMDRFEINQKFYSLFNQLINITIPDVRGIIDQAELETILTCKGNLVMSNDIKLISHKHSNNTIFTQYEYGCRYIATLVKDNINTEELEREVGVPYDTFVGYSNNEFIALAGLSYPHKRFEQLIEIINSKQNDMVGFSNNLNLEAPKLKPHTIVKTTQEQDNINFDQLFQKYMD